MQLSSRLPVATTVFRHWHTDDTEVAVVVAKAEFGRRPDGRFRANRSAPDLHMTEVFDEGEPGFAPLLNDQDIVPGKRGTDLILRAIARSPDGAALPDWEVSVAIPERLHYAFRVRGTSEWRRGLLGWKLTDPELVNEVSLSYALAYGGSAPGDDPETPEVYENNPAGIGLASRARLDGNEPFPAPQIGALAEFITGDPTLEMTVHGTMPIAKAWLPRRGFAGTFDAGWEAQRHPRMPKDYSLAFWNCAPGPLQLDPGLEGAEVIRVGGISHAPAPVEVVLPGVGLSLALSGNETGRLGMSLDTVDLDLRDPDPANHAIHLTWRAIVAQPNTYDAGEIEGVRLEAKETA